MRTPVSPKRSRLTVPVSSRGSGYWNQTSLNSISPFSVEPSRVVAPGRSVIAGTRSRYSKIRRNRASEVCTSSVTRISCSSGICRRACNVVNATSVPAVSDVPPLIIRPAARYRRAGVMAKDACTVAKNARPVMACSTCSRACSRLASR